MKTSQLHEISEIRLMRVKLNNRCGGNSNIVFQKTNILTYNLAITQSFPILRYEVGADKRLVKELMTVIYISFTKFVDRTTTRLDPHSISSPILKKKVNLIYKQNNGLRV